jgi:hypothetical protein
MRCFEVIGDATRQLQTVISSGAASRQAGGLKEFLSNLRQQRPETDYTGKKEVLHNEPPSLICTQDVSLLDAR